jgi:hypothetical protein
MSASVVSTADLLAARTSEGFRVIDVAAGNQSDPGGHPFCCI